MKLTDNLRVSLGFMRASDLDAAETAQGVEEGMKNNPAFPKPPVPLVPPAIPDPNAPVDLQTLRLSFSAACVLSGPGGTQLTADKNIKGGLLKDAMHKLAMYVQIIARHDLALLLSSGFEASSKNRASIPLLRPDIMAIINEASGALLVRGASVLNARSYQVQASTDGGKTWVDMDDSTGARRIVVQPVTPGTVYTIRIRAVGGSTKFSEWSNAVSRMAT